jgi:histidinol phosphatase-like PHP family hydrolase
VASEKGAFASASISGAANISMLTVRMCFWLVNGLSESHPKLLEDWNGIASTFDENLWFLKKNEKAFQIRTHHVTPLPAMHSS